MPNHEGFRIKIKRKRVLQEAKYCSGKILARVAGWGPLLGSGSTFVPTISLSPPAALGGGLYRSQTGPVSRGGLAKWSRGPSPSTRLAGAWCLAPDLFSVMGK